MSLLHKHRHVVVSERDRGRGSEAERERARARERERDWLEGMLGSAGVEFCPLQTSLFLHVLSNAHKVAPLRDSHSSR